MKKHIINKRNFLVLRSTVVLLSSTLYAYRLKTKICDTVSYFFRITYLSLIGTLYNVQIIAIGPIAQLFFD